MTIMTPEGVPMELRLAGVGSRAAAAAIDLLIQFGLIVALVILFEVGSSGDLLDGQVATPDPSESEFFWLLALFNVLLFLILFLYYMLFEALWSGRTPGKRASRLRVVRVAGGPVDFRSVAIRNLLRLVDLLPLNYGIGIISILATQHNQRIGDLVAGTLVVRDTPIKEPARSRDLARLSAGLQRTEELNAWDVSGISQQDFATVRKFLERRDDLKQEVRTRIAKELATRLRSQVGGVNVETMPYEAFLERLAAAKAARR